jgi:16S rRNA (uracil1498-N3)-methyltransferase
MPRFHLPLPLSPGARLTLPDGAARHAQVLRLQPGDAVTLFNGQGGHWLAHITRMGRVEVEVAVQAHHAIEREAARAVHLAAGLIAAERMDWLVEKAAELGAASLTPLHLARSSLRLSGERAARKHAHWQAVAVAACEQSGRNRLLEVRAPLTLPQWLAVRGAAPAACWMLALDQPAQPLHTAAAALSPAAPLHLLSGPEGGFTPEEAAAARAAGCAPVSLGTRVLRAETAPLAALAALTAQSPE